MGLDESGFSWTDTGCEDQMQNVAPICQIKYIASCPGEEWSKFNGNCYQAFNTPTNWFNAEQHCFLAGGHLTSIHSDEETAFLSKLVGGDLLHWVGAINQNGGWVWTDGSEWEDRETLPSSGYESICKFAANDGLHFNNCEHFQANYICKIPGQ